MIEVDVTDACARARACVHRRTARGGGARRLHARAARWCWVGVVAVAQQRHAVRFEERRLARVVARAVWFRRGAAARSELGVLRRLQAESGRAARGRRQVELSGARARGLPR